MFLEGMLGVGKGDGWAVNGSSPTSAMGNGVIDNASILHHQPGRRGRRKSDMFAIEGMFDGSIQSRKKKLEF